MLKKKCFALVLCLALLVTANLPVLARGGYRCDVCNTGTVTVQSRTVIYDGITGTKICPKTNMDFDQIHTREWIEHEECDNPACDAAYDVLYTHTEIICNH